MAAAVSTKLNVKIFKYFSYVKSSIQLPVRSISQIYHRSQDEVTTGLHPKTEFGLFFDIDGVIVRGKDLLPGVKDAFRMLLTNARKFWIPTIFVTNAGNCLRQTKANQLSEWLGIEITSDQVIMSHSALRLFTHMFNKHVLVSGQGPVHQIAKGLGFQKITTVDALSEAFPQLDMVDYKRRKADADAHEKFFPRIEGVILFGEPVRWETSLQLIIDALVTNGRPSEAPGEIPYPHIPVLGCNMDLMWMSEACMPRFAHGCFLHCLESLYEKITGYKLKYTALVGKPSELTYHYSEHVLQQQANVMGLPQLKRMYCIGDNPDADVFGANMYNNYLHKKLDRLAMKRQKLRQGDSRKTGKYDSNELQEGSVTSSHNINSLEEANESHLGVEECISILVSTGVWNEDRDYANNHQTLNILNHAHRDFVMDPELRKPALTADNVLHAVEKIFKRENL